MPTRAWCGWCGVSGPAMKCSVPATHVGPHVSDASGCTRPVPIQSASDAQLLSAKIFASVWNGPKAKAQVEALGESTQCSLVSFFIFFFDASQNPQYMMAKAQLKFGWFLISTKLLTKCLTALQVTNTEEHWEWSYFQNIWVKTLISTKRLKFSYHPNQFASRTY